MARNATSCFLTRGDLWLNWVDGLRVFQEYLLDADWSVNAGNWMWVSSSAFEKFLDTSDIISPVNYGRMFEPTGEYIRRYVPELRGMPTEYIFSPWEAPLSVQREAGCVVGEHYPCRMVNHEVASRHNRKVGTGTDCVGEHYPCRMVNHEMASRHNRKVGTRVDCERA